ncbi:MAG TPA: hypothetical protein VNA89_15405 [Gemmatimonadaceae bacterium]|nr:hypothetical protein [Gemmatimonadaceae bacterium]
MNEYLRDRVLRKLETLSDERGYQVLDYVEFLESKYGEKTGSSPSILQRFSEVVEDGLRAGRIPASTIGEAMGLMNRAMGVLSGVAAAGKSVANDIVGASSRPPAKAGTGPLPAAAPEAAVPPAPSRTPVPTPATTPAPTPTPAVTSAPAPEPEPPSIATMTQSIGGETQ